MTNRLVTLKELADDWNRTIQEYGVDPKEFALSLAYGLACAYDEDEEREVRRVVGLE